jgi:hypothetical protein
MKNLFIILICSILLVSCDTKLYEVSEPEKETTISDIKLLESDSTNYKILVDGNRFNVYSSDNKIVYKDCRSSYNNNILAVPSGIFTFMVVLILISVLYISVFND